MWTWGGKLEQTHIDTFAQQMAMRTHTNRHRHRHTQERNTHTHRQELFSLQVGFSGLKPLIPALLSLTECVAAGCLCSYISMHYGGDEAPFTWREQQHGAEQVRQSLDVPQPANNRGRKTRWQKKNSQTDLGVGALWETAASWMLRVTHAHSLQSKEETQFEILGTWGGYGYFWQKTIEYPL